MFKCDPVKEREFDKRIEAMKERYRKVILDFKPAKENMLISSKINRLINHVRKDTTGEKLDEIVSELDSHLIGLITKAHKQTEKIAQDELEI